MELVEYDSSTDKSLDCLLSPIDSPYSHLPPPWAWKDADRWLGDINYRHNPRNRLDLPVDDRGFVKTYEAVEMVKDLFVPSYDWIARPGDQRTRLDDHHFYHDEDDYRSVNNDGDSTPMAFRNAAPNIGTMMRLFHNSLHHVFPKPEMPDVEAMRDYLLSYTLAKQAFTNLYIAANNTLNAQHLRISRRMDVKRNSWILGDREYDTIGEEFNENKFKLHFARYLSALNTFQGIDNKDILVPGKRIKLERSTPQQIIRIGKIANRTAVNYHPVIQAQAA